MEGTARETLRIEDKDYLTFGPALIAMQEAFDYLKEKQEVSSEDQMQVENVVSFALNL